jgi:hypothetical protein
MPCTGSKIAGFTVKTGLCWSQEKRACAQHKHFLIKDLVLNKTKGTVATAKFL